MGIFSKFERSVENGLEGAADKMFDAPISPVQISKKAEKAMRREKMVGAGKQYAPTLYTVMVNAEDDKRLFGYYPTLAGETETYLAARADEDGLIMDGQPLVRFIVDEGLRRGKFNVIAELVSAPIVAQLRQEEMQRYGLAGGVAPQAADAQSPAADAQASTVAAQQAATVQAANAEADVQHMPVASAPQQAAPMQKSPVQAQDSLPETQDSFQDSFAMHDGPHEHGAYADRLAVSRSDPENLVDPASIVQKEEADPSDWRKQPLPYVPEEEIDRSIDYGEYTFNSQDFEDYEEHGPKVAPVSGAVAAQSKPWDDDEDDFEVEADLSGLDVEAYNPYAHDSRDLFEEDSAPASAGTVSFAGGEVRPSRSLATARLIDKSTNRSYDLAASRLIIGRSSQSDIVIDDVNASRSHVELRQESPGVWILTDLGSTNGTEVNGEFVASCELELGDRIVVGTTELVFLQD